MDPLQLRIETALTKLLEPHVVLSDSKLECLLRFLTDKEEDLGASAYPQVREEFLIPWLKQAVDRLKSSPFKPRRNVLTFTSGLIASVCSDEETFVKLNFTNIVVDFVEMVRSAPDPLIRPIYVGLMTSLLAHRSGLQFVIVRNLWFDVYSMISLKGDEETSRRCCRFVVSLLEKTKRDDEIFCCSVIETMLAPFSDLAVVHSLSSDALIEYDSLRMSIVVLKGILEMLYEKNCNEVDFTVITIIKDRYRLDETVDSLITAVLNPELRLELYKFSYLLGYFEVARAIFLHLNISQEYSERMMTYIVDVIERYGTEMFLEIFTVKLGYFRKISCMSSSSLKMNYGFLSQMLLVVVRPLHYYAFDVLELQKCNQNDDDYRKLFTLKVLTDMVPVTFQTVCRLSNSSKKFTIEDATLCLRYLESLSVHFVHDFANNVAQMLIYLLVDILIYLKDRPERITLFSSEFIMAFLHTLKVLLRRFDLSWRDGPEVIYVGGVIVDFLGFDWWTHEIVVEALELLDVSIAKCLSPKMALLIDSDSEEARCFKDIVLRKIADDEADVRDAAVKVVTALCAKAMKKFKSYANTVLEVDLPEMVLKMATRDPSGQVRVSAFECLEEMARHEEFRLRILDVPKGVHDTVETIYSHDEARVRAAAVSFVDALHSRTPHLLAELHKCLASAARHDRDVAVKTRALRFWRTVAWTLLDDHGAEKGVFPEVTFSKRRRKIVQFNVEEIRRCLDDVLDELSVVGGLGVFMEALRSDRKELRTSAIALVGDFIALLNRYYFPTEPPRSLDVAPMEVPREFPPSTTMDVSPCLDNFCEDILNLEDFLMGAESTTAATSTTSSSGLSSPETSQASSPGDRRLLEKNEFLRFACNYDFYRDMETGRDAKESNNKKTEENVFTVLRDILAA